MHFLGQGDGLEHNGNIVSLKISCYANEHIKRY